MVQPAKIRAFSRPGWQFVGLIVVSFLQFALFERNAARYQAWIYPRWFDQVQYLTEAYQGHEYGLSHGFLAAVKHTLTNVSPQGTLHDFWALLVFSITGPSRSAALAINLLGFLALQASLFVSVRRMTGGFTVAWMALGFLMALKCPWSGGPASTVDFRLDWMAACAYGIALGAGIATDAFRSTRWSVVFGAAVGVVLLTRTLTAVYFLLIFAALLTGLLSRADRWARSGRLLGSALIALALAGPAFWHNRQAIHDYYWVGQIAGPERILRDSHFGLAASVWWMLRELSLSVIGVAGLALFFGASSALWSLRSVKRARGEIPGTGGGPGLPAWGMAFVFLAAPAGVLCIHPTKAEEPLTLLLSPIVWLVAIGSCQLARKVKRRSLMLVSATTIAAGAMIFATFLSRWPPSSGVASDARTMNALVDYVYYRSEECGLKRPRFAATLTSDGLSAGAFRVLGYERHRLWLDIEQTLPIGLFESPPENIRQQLAGSDFVCLLTSAREEAWPFDRQMAGLLSEMRPWCETHLKHVADIDAFGFSFSLYERKGLERADGGAATDFASLLGANLQRHADAMAIPSARPFFVLPPRVLWSAHVEGSSRLRAAYSPVRYEAVGLPKGVELDPCSGEIHGQLRQVGSFTAKVTATNAAGSTTGDLTLQAENKAFIIALNAPSKGTVGRPVEIDFEAFDATEKLDFIDIADSTEGKLVDRLAAGEGDRQSWQGRYGMTFTQPGVHALVFRFARFDASAKEPYSFVDQEKEIEIAP